tara:strand:- start:1505 stop:2131 length:627 start_codon:yes stop_codon:yes gene_type:complete
MRTQTHKEELLNSLTHGIGFLLSLVGFVLLIVYKSFDSTASTIAIILYGVSLAVLYFVSTLYHYEKNEHRKNIYRKLDHISIYYLIAGTYSPVVLIAIDHSMGWTLFWTVWGIAIFGTILKVFFTGKFEIISVILYLVMGWLIVLDFSALQESVSTTGLYLLMGGGLAYTVGIVFYAMDKIKYSHVIWHLFVLLGSILHYLFIFLTIL